MEEFTKVQNADGSVKPSSTDYLAEVNIGNNLMTGQAIRTNGYYESTGAWTTSSGFFSLVDYIPVEQNVKYNNVFYNVRGYDINNNLVLNVSNNKSPVSFNDGVTVKIRPNFKTVDATTANAYIYKVGFSANNLLLLNNNLSDGLITGSKLANNSTGYDKITADLQRFFPRVFTGWELGYIDSSGALIHSPNNIRTTTPYFIGAGNNISLKDTQNYTFKIIAYTLSNGVYTFVSRSGLLSEYIVPNDGFTNFKCKNDLTDITDITEQVNKFACA
jgi:hypothetical protein